jgi:hypothetical protein
MLGSSSRNQREYDHWKTIYPAKTNGKTQKNPESFFCTGSRRSGLMAIARGWRHAAHKRKSPAGEPTSASAWAI